MSALHPTTARRYLETPGFTSAADNVGAIRKMIERGKRDPEIRALALKIFADDDVNGRDEIGEVAALLSFVQTHYPYRRDIVGVETLQSAKTSLRNLQAGIPNGDCDDYAILLGSLLESVGHPIRLVITAPAGAPDRFQHIYLETAVRGRGWVPVDATNGRAPVGWESPLWGRKRIFTMTGETSEQRAEPTMGTCRQDCVAFDGPIEDATAAADNVLDVAASIVGSAKQVTALVGTGAQIYSRIRQFGKDPTAPLTPNSPISSASPPSAILLVGGAVLLFLLIRGR